MMLPNGLSSSNSRRTLGVMVLSCAGLVTGCSTPAKRSEPPVNCAQLNELELGAITPEFWFGFGDDTPGAYNGYADGVMPEAGQPVSSLQTPPEPTNLANLARNRGFATVVTRCQEEDTADYFFKTHGHKDWGSAWGSEVRRRAAPYAAGEVSPRNYEGIALWARSERGADKGLKLEVDTAQTAKPSDGERERRVDDEGKPLLDEFGEPIVLLDENGEPWVDEEGHAVQNHPDDCKEPVIEEGAATYRRNSAGQLVITSGVASADDCGNPFTYLLYTTDRWELYLIPWSAFWQLAEPNRDPNGIDPSSIYSFRFRAEKEMRIEMWVDALSFYRHTDWEPPGGFDPLPGSGGTNGEGGGAGIGEPQ